MRKLRSVSTSTRVRKPAIIGQCNAKERYLAYFPGTELSIGLAIEVRANQGSMGGYC